MVNQNHWNQRRFHCDVDQHEEKEQVHSCHYKIEDNLKKILKSLTMDIKNLIIDIVNSY